MDNKCICSSCGKEIPANSTFCPFCGKRAEKELKPSAPSRTPLIVSTIILAVLCIGLVAGFIGFYFSAYMPLESAQKGFDSKLKNKTDRIEAVEAELRKTTNQIGDLNSEINNLKSQNQELAQDNLFVEDLETLLQGAKTSNGIISVSSKVYAVKKGESETIRVNWPNYQTTMYMGTGKAFVVNAEWVGENIKITGKKEGVTSLNFGSDSNTSKNAFSVVLICY